MSFIDYFSKQPTLKEIPSLFQDPFDQNLSALAILAGESLQRRLEKNSFCELLKIKGAEGKMFGVLVVQDDKGKVGYLSAFSGMLNKHWYIEGFVPPIFDDTKLQSFLPTGEKKLKRFAKNIQCILNNEHYVFLLKQKKAIEIEHQQIINDLRCIHKLNKSKRAKKRLEIQRFDDYSLIKAELEVLSWESQKDRKQLKQLRLKLTNDRIRLDHVIHSLYEVPLLFFKNKQSKLSLALHKKVFSSYILVNGLNKKIALQKVFEDKLPPGGAGDCAAPKLIHFANKNRLRPIALAEFWWGNAPNKEVRRHKHYYQPCRSKCYKILPAQLLGHDVKPSGVKSTRRLRPDVIFEDDVLIVLNKPAGMLSIPGKEESHSVLSWLRQQYPNASGGLLLHRLDQATSGLLIATKTPEAYKAIQKQFMHRKIKKRYTALLSKRLTMKTACIELPLRVDIDDRPRQLVCFEHGKKSYTTMILLNIEGEYSRVNFFPITGRTHQLRVHAAHHLGLGAPIVGDQLYGSKDSRLMLHADKIEFMHPSTGKKACFKAPVPF